MIWFENVSSKYCQIPPFLLIWEYYLNFVNVFAQWNLEIFLVFYDETLFFRISGKKSVFIDRGFFFWIVWDHFLFSGFLGDLGKFSGNISFFFFTWCPFFNNGRWFFFLFLCLRSDSKLLAGTFSTVYCTPEAIKSSLIYYTWTSPK